VSGVAIFVIRDCLASIVDMYNWIDYHLNDDKKEARDILILAELSCQSLFRAAANLLPSQLASLCILLGTDEIHELPDGYLDILSLGPYPAPVFTTLGHAVHSPKPLPFPEAEHTLVELPELPAMSSIRPSSNLTALIEYVTRCDQLEQPMNFAEWRENLKRELSQAYALRFPKRARENPRFKRDAWQELAPLYYH
jgi:hypothetical protein